MTTWGAWSASGGNSFRLGWDAAFSDGNRLNVWIRLENQYNVSGDAITLSWSGTWAGSTGATVTAGSGSVTTIYADIIGSQAYGTTSSTTFTVAGLYNGSRPSVTMTVDLGALVNPPGTPGTPSVAYVSDNQLDLSWAAASNSPDSTAVWRASNVEEGRVVANLGGAATFLSDTTVSPDFRYRYVISVANSAGNASSGTSVDVCTTPRQPTGASATGSSSGITVRWANATSLTAWSNVEVEHATNGAWDGTRTTLAGTATSYIHASPSTTVTHMYRVRAVTTDGRKSAWTVTNSVALLAPPNAPTNLAPDGATTPATEDLVLSWAHNPVDTTAQTKMAVRYRVSGASTWTVMATSVTPAQAITIQPATAWSATNGATFEWQVQTWGQHATASPWSATATVRFAARPIATITSPAATAGTPTITVAWAYAGSTAQAAWQVQVVDAAQLVIESPSGGDAATSTVLATRFPNGWTGTIRVRVQSAVGLWSAWASRTLSITFPTPAVPTVALTWDLAAAAVLVTVTNPAGTPAVVANDLQRSFDGGLTWVTVAAGLPVSPTWVDPVPPLHQPVSYRVIATTALPSTSTSLTYTTTWTGPLDRLWLSGGPGRGLTCAAYYALRVAEDAPELESALRQWAGRELPVLYEGTAVEQALKVSFVAVARPRVPVATWEQWMALLRMPGPKILRTYTRYWTVHGVAAHSVESPRGRHAVDMTLQRVADA